jgi:hypothetical protein
MVSDCLKNLSRTAHKNPQTMETPDTFFLGDFKENLDKMGITFF